LFHGKITATLFSITLRQPLSALANLGVVMFMFAVGYLLDLRLIRGRERVAASVSVSSIILPLSLGVGLGVWLASRHHVHQVLPFALFVGTAMSVTAFSGARPHPHRPRHASHPDRRHRAPRG
jgi:K+:H+ antiporter